jgi:hypothetical protein
MISPCKSALPNSKFSLEAAMFLRFLIIILIATPSVSFARVSTGPDSATTMDHRLDATSSGGPHLPPINRIRS